MKAILALFLLFAATPNFGSSPADEAPTPSSPAVAAADAAECQDPPYGGGGFQNMDCGGCAATLQFQVIQDTQVPCITARDAVLSVRLIKLQPDHGGADCGVCVEHQQKCINATNKNCKMHATIKITLRDGFSFNPFQSQTVLEIPINAESECNSGFLGQDLRVFAGSCSFAFRVNYYCSKCRCPQIA